MASTIVWEKHHNRDDGVNSDDTIDDALFQNPPVVGGMTTTTIQQKQTELECTPYFVEFDTISSSQLEYLCHTTGLLVADNSGDEEKASAQGEESDAGATKTTKYQVSLLREKHMSYLYDSVFCENATLKSSFVTLDASRTWMMYWSYHTIDLLTVDDDANDTMIHDRALHSRMLFTLQKCFTKCAKATTVRSIHSDFLTDDSSAPSLLGQLVAKRQQQEGEFLGGGFGGGTQQLPHAATSYAAVLTLCILAKHQAESYASTAALDLLQSIRPELFIWIHTLFVIYANDDTTNDNSCIAVRMQDDGEIDIRATYCIVCIVSLLYLPLPTSAYYGLLRHISNCYSSYENGGYGSEANTEPHGGYTYCAVAAQQLLYGLILRNIQNTDPTNVAAQKVFSDQVHANQKQRHGTMRWLVQRQLTLEGGFAGRTNKLVDGCYSFWQGAAVAIASHNVQLPRRGTAAAWIDENDPWIAPPRVETKPHRNRKSGETPSSSKTSMLCDVPMLERYILLCAQDVHGGLRDKPSKPRDFYHTCYNVSGLSVAQQYGDAPRYGHTPTTQVRGTHPCYNIRVACARHVLEYFSKKKELPL